MIDARAGVGYAGRAASLADAVVGCGRWDGHEFGCIRRPLGCEVSERVTRSRHGPTRLECWELPDAGWADWAATVDRFLAHALRGIAATCSGGQAAWLEVFADTNSGRLIVFPSRDGVGWDRGEPVRFELESRHLDEAWGRLIRELPPAGQDAGLEELDRRAWARVGECLTAGEASRELAAARRSLRLLVSGYDGDPEVGRVRLSEAGEFVAELGAAADTGGVTGPS